MSLNESSQIVVVGGAITDYLVRGDVLPRAGETAEGDVFQQAPGGKGANQAVAAARLGATVAFVGRIGDDERGREILARLADERINTRYVATDAETATAAALVMVGGDGEKQILTAPGANRRLAVGDVEAAAATITAAKVLLTQLETTLEAVTTAMRLAREAGVRIVLDPAPARALPDEVLRMASVIKPNAHEAKALTGIDVVDRNTALQAARQLLGRGVEAVAIEAAREGNLMVAKGFEQWLPLVPVEAVDATGAGDAFAAALAVMLAEGRGLHEAGPFASAAAALATTKLGAQAGLPQRREVADLVGRQNSTSNQTV